MSRQRVDGLVRNILNRVVAIFLVVILVASTGAILNIHNCLTCHSIEISLLVDNDCHICSAKPSDDGTYFVSNCCVHKQLKIELTDITLPDNTKPLKPVLEMCSEDILHEEQESEINNYPLVTQVNLDNPGKSIVQFIIRSHPTVFDDHLIS